MSATAVAAAGAAVAYYFYTWRRGRAPASDATDVETHVRAHREPNTWMEALYFFAEGLRYMYGETLGKWRTADLLIGLAYLARRESDEHPCSHVAQRGTPLGHGMSVAECQAALDEMRVIQRFMKYCVAMRERRAAVKQRMMSNIGIEPSDILKAEPKAGVLRPSYIIVRDRKLKSIVLAVRGTHSIKDAFTNLTGASKPHHVLNEQGLVLGYCHFGMLAAARWIHREATPMLNKHLEDHPGYSLRVMGHSLGGGTAALLAMMLREQYPTVTCVALACPGCMTLELAQSCAGYVTTVVNGTDLVPTMSPAAADALREEVMQSAWYEAFRSDLRSSFIVRAVEGSLRHVGSATVWTARATTASVAACYQAAPRAPSFAMCSPVAPPRPPHTRRPTSSPSPTREGGGGDEGGPRSRRGHPGGLRQRHGGGAGGGGLQAPLLVPEGQDWTVDDAMLIEVAREWASRVDALELRVDQAARPQGGMDRGDTSSSHPPNQHTTDPRAPQPLPPAKTPRGGNLFTRWWFGACRTQGPGRLSLVEQYERQIEEQALAHELQQEWDASFTSPDPPPLSPFNTAPPPPSLSMDPLDPPDEDPEGDSLTETLTDLHHQLNTELSRVQAAVTEEEACEDIDDVRLSGAAEACTPHGTRGTPDAGEENDDNDDDDEAGHSSARSAAMARRKTYPAGRILHLIPAYLLLGEEALFEEYGGGPGTRGSMHSTSMTHNTTSATHNNTSATHNTSSSAHHASISHNTAGGCDGIHTTTRIVAGEYADYHADTDPTTTTTNTMDAHQHANTTPHKHTSHTSTAPTHPPAMSPAPSLGGGGPSQTLGGGPAGSPAPSLGGGMPSLAAHIVGSPPRVFSGSVRGGGGGGLLSDEEGEEHVYSRSGSMRPEATSSKALKGKRIRYMLMDRVPHECYGRIRLCRTMIQDHFVPCYAKNMESALHTLIETFVLPQHFAEAHLQSEPSSAPARGV